MIVSKQLAKQLLKSTELGRSYSPPKLAIFFEPQCIFYSYLSLWVTRVDRVPTIP